MLDQYNCITVMESKISIKPDSEQIADLGLAGSAWNKEEQRNMEDGK